MTLPFRKNPVAGDPVPPVGNMVSQVAPGRPVGTGTLVARGTFWLFVQMLGTKSVMLAGQIVVAWLLSKEDFGQIAMAYTVTAFIALLINPGIDLILVQRGRSFHLWSTPAFYFSLTTGILGGVVILAVAPLAARLYGTPQLSRLLTILAIATPLGSLMLVPTAKLRYQMRFKALSAINFSQTLLQTVLTLVFAAAGFGVYAFVLPMPIVYLAGAAALWALARPVVRLRNPFRHWRYLIGDSSYIFGQRALLTATEQSDNIILGMMYGQVVLGPYFFAFSIAQQAARLTAGSVQLVLMTGLSRMPAYSPQQTQAALRATRALALIGTPFCMLQAALADPLLRSLYQTKWLAAIPLVQLISLGMGLSLPSWGVGSLLQARRQFRFAFYWSLFFAPIYVAAMFVGALVAQSIGVAVVVFLYMTFASPLLVIWVFRSSNVGWGEILGLHLRAFLVGLFSAIASLGVTSQAEAAGWPAMAQFATALCVGLICALIAARLAMPDTWHEILTKMRGLFPRLSPFRG